MLIDVIWIYIVALYQLETLIPSYNPIYRIYNPNTGGAPNHKQTAGNQRNILIPPGKLELRYES